MKNMTLNMWVWEKDIILCKMVISNEKVKLLFYVRVAFTLQKPMCMLAGLLFSSFPCTEKNKFVKNEIYIYLIEYRYSL